MRTHYMITGVLSLIQVEIATSMREAATGTNRKYDLQKVWDHVVDARILLEGIDNITKEEDRPVGVSGGIA